MKILGLIPARGGSKGVPQKNQRLLAGKPLITYTILAALDCQFMDTLVVSTDSKSIANISKEAGADVPFMRPAALASDNSPTIDTVLHALEFYEKAGHHFDAICLLQPTCPLRNTADINGAIEAFKNSNADSLISVKQVPHVYNPHWVFEQKENEPYLKIATGEQQIIPRRQDLPTAYFRDGSIYITRTSVLKNKASLYGDNIAFYESTNAYHVNIDTMDDWKEAEKIIKDLNI